MATEGPKALKTPVNILVIGPAGHGKTTLTDALTKVGIDRFGKRITNYDSDQPVPEEKVFNSTISIARTEYESQLREYHHVDCPTQGDCIKAMLSGKAPMDGVILVWSAASEDEKPRMVEALLLATRIGVTNIVVFLNKAEVGGDAVDLMVKTTDVRNVLAMRGLGNYGIPVIAGSARLALNGDPSEFGVPSIIKLVDALDSRIPTPARDVDKPFLMAVETSSSSNDGTVMTGRIERGIVKVGDSAEVIGQKDTQRTTVMALNILRKQVDQAKAGETVDLRVTTADVAPGQVLAKPGSVAPYAKFAARVYMLTQDERGRRTPFFGNYSPQFHFRTDEATGSVKLPPGVGTVSPGGTADIDVTLNFPVAIEKGQCFSIYEGTTPVGYGVVLTLT